MIDLDHIPGTEAVLKGDKRDLSIRQDITDNELQNLLNLLRENCIDFELHDLGFPTISDPGAYISYSQTKNT